MKLVLPTRCVKSPGPFCCDTHSEQQMPCSWLPLLSGQTLGREATGFALLMRASPRLLAVRVSLSPSVQAPAKRVDRRLREIAIGAKGFIPEPEGLVLYEAGLKAGSLGPLLEIGTYCGKSAVYLGAAAKERSTVLYTIDHHQGSEEMQSGWDHHDDELIEPETGRMNSLPFFRKTMSEAKLDDVVIAMVGDSQEISQNWTTQVGLVFIDGAHSEGPAMVDFESWAPKLLKGGLLAIHDVFPDPKEGGQGPFKVYKRALADGFVDERAEGSLKIVKAVS